MKSFFLAVMLIAAPALATVTREEYEIFNRLAKLLWKDGERLKVEVYYNSDGFVSAEIKGHIKDKKKVLEVFEKKEPKFNYSTLKNEFIITPNFDAPIKISPESSELDSSPIEFPSDGKPEDD